MIGRELEEYIMLVYLKTGNKRGITRMKVLVSEDPHSCLRCPYNTECKLMCYRLERILELQEKVKEEFGIESLSLRITPLRIERLRARNYSVWRKSKAELEFRFIKSRF